MFFELLKRVIGKHITFYYSYILLAILRDSIYLRVSYISFFLKVTNTIV